MTQLVDFKSATQPLAGQVAIITGGGRGLGRAYALALASAGAAIAVIARTATEIQAVQREIEQQGGRARAIPTDVTDAHAVAQMVAAVEQQLGAVDLLVNNAGVCAPLAASAKSRQTFGGVIWKSMCVAPFSVARRSYRA